MPKPKPFLKNLSEQINTIKTTTEKSIRLFFQDEGRFGRISQLRRCWGPKGKRAVVPAQHIRQYTYTFTAIEPATGQSVSLILPWVNGETMSLFLAEMSQRYPQEHLVVVLDGAGWHKSRTLVVPEHMTLVFLPPYSPELNPVEQLWKLLRGKYFANKLYKSMKALEDNLVKALCWVESSWETIRSLSLYSWIKYALSI
jgi:transposase